MPEIKAYDIKSWPSDWREKGEMAKKILLTTPGLSINSPEYHDYQDYCFKVILYDEEMKQAKDRSK